jgi:uncharacterized protein
MDTNDTPKQDRIQLSTGSFTIEELEALFSALPAEISFVSNDDTVRFFSDKPDRLFLRGKGALGKDLRLCHPPRFQAMMLQIIEDFKSGKETHAQFWRSSHKGKFTNIEYFALKNANGDYLGALEVVQDITGLRLLEGDRDQLVYDSKE